MNVTLANLQQVVQILKARQLERSLGSFYVYGWLNCNCCGANIYCVRKMSKAHPDPGGMVLPGERFIVRPKRCPACNEVYSTHIRPEFYAKEHLWCPQDCLMIFEEEAV